MAVAVAERLQRVLDHQAAGVTGHAPGHVQQLAEQRRGRQRRVVVLAPADVAQVQAIARRQQRIEHQVTILVACHAVAGAMIVGQAVELGRPAAARKLPVAQAQHAHHPKRNRPHRRQRAAGQRTGDEGARRAGLVQHARQLRLDHRPRQRHRAAAGLRLLRQTQQRAAQQRERVSLVFVNGLEQRQRTQQAPRPLGRRVRAGQIGLQLVQAAQQLGQRADRLRQLAATRRQRQHLIQRSGVRGMAQQQAVQAGAPGVLVAGRQIEPGPRRGVVGKAHAAVLHQRAQARQARHLDAKGGAQRRQLQQREHL